jgi:hypothetical protein
MPLSDTRQVSMAIRAARNFKRAPPSLLCHSPQFLFRFRPRPTLALGQAHFGAADCGTHRRNCRGITSERKLRPAGGSVLNHARPVCGASGRSGGRRLIGEESQFDPRDERELVLNVEEVIRENGRSGGRRSSGASRRKCGRAPAL